MRRNVIIIEFEMFKIQLEIECHAYSLWTEFTSSHSNIVSESSDSSAIQKVKNGKVQRRR